jgi:hypothetical protein
MENNEIKIKGNRAYRYSRIQGRWFPISLETAKQLISEGKAIIYNPLYIVK